MTSHFDSYLTSMQQAEPSNGTRKRELSTLGFYKNRCEPENKKNRSSEHRVKPLLGKSTIFLNKSCTKFVETGVAVNDQCHFVRELRLVDVKKCDNPLVFTTYDELKELGHLLYNVPGLKNEFTKIEREKIEETPKVKHGGAGAESFTITTKKFAGADVFTITQSVNEEHERTLCYKYQTLKELAKYFGAIRGIYDQVLTYPIEKMFNSIVNIPESMFDCAGGSDADIFHFMVNAPSITDGVARNTPEHKQLLKLKFELAANYFQLLKDTLLKKQDGEIA